MNCKQNENKQKCICTYPCGRKGLCCECVEYHRKMDQIPACFFSKEAEKTYDRSIEAFIKDYRNRNK